MNRKLIIIGISAVALITTGCAKSGSASINSSAEKQLEAWMALHYPDAPQTSLGCYIIEDEEGTGTLVGDLYTHPFFSMRFTARDLAGNISETTEIPIAQQIGTYKSCNYYGPVTASRYYTSDDDDDEGSYTIPAGLDDVITTMRVGGKRKAIIPGWLMSYNRYSDGSSYKNNEQGVNMMYDVEITDAIYDLFQYQVDSITRYMEHNLTKVDSTINGLYYVQHVAPEDTTGYDAGVVVKVDYIGRLLNGQVFDTTIKDTAKVYGIYSASNSYEPMKVKLASKYTENTLSSSTDSYLIPGFSYCVSKMRKGEIGSTVFYSELGYGDSGSGNLIPTYSPLRFDIVFIGPEDEDEDEE